MPIYGKSFLGQKRTLFCPYLEHILACFLPDVQYSGNCLFNATKTVSADNQDILYTTCVDAKNDVGSQLSDHSIIAYGIMDGIYIEDRIFAGLSFLLHTWK